MSTAGSLGIEGDPLPQEGPCLKKSADNNVPCQLMGEPVPFGHGWQGSVRTAVHVPMLACMHMCPCRGGDGEALHTMKSACGHT